MKKGQKYFRGIIFAVSGISIYIALLFGFSVEAVAAPVLYIEKDVYDFGAILEGTIITRDFIIENKGDEPLLIPRVRSNCACAVADYTEKIMPGEKGSVTLEFDSKGSSGMVNYKIRGDSNDPNKENFDLTIKGHVDPILIIEPKKVTLSGTAGENLETVIIIDHDRRHPLKVLSAESLRGNVSVQLDEMKGSEKGKYIIKVTSLRKEKGNYKDNIKIKTDSDIFPEKQIIVRINIR